MKFKGARSRLHLCVLPLISLCVFGAGFQANCGNKEKKMESSSYVVGLVDEFEVAPDGDSDTLRMLNQGEYKISKKDPKYDWYANVIRDYKAERKPLFVEFEPIEKKVLNIFLPSKRRIEYVADQPKDGKLDVALLMAPSLYFLKTTRKGYEEMRKLLTESVKNQSVVLVTTDPDTKEILDARLQP